MAAKKALTQKGKDALKLEEAESRALVARKALADLNDGRNVRSMGNTTCDCCRARVPVEDTFPGRVLGCGPFCSKCRPWWDTSRPSRFGEGCPHDGTESADLDTPGGGR